MYMSNALGKAGEITRLGYFLKLLFSQISEFTRYSLFNKTVNTRLIAKIDDYFYWIQK